MCGLQFGLQPFPINLKKYIKISWCNNSSMIQRVFVLILSFLCVFSLPTYAQDEKNPHTLLAIGIVNVEKVQLNSLAFQSLREQLEKLRAETQEKIKLEQENIQAEQEELEKQKLLLSNDVLTERQTKLQQKIANLREFADNTNRGLEDAYNQALFTIGEKLKESLAEVAEERSLTLILNENNIPPTVIFNADFLRIDEVVLQKLNQRINSIEITAAPEETAISPESSSSTSATQ